jgi:hypothetical protein
LRFKDQGSGFRVQGSGPRVQKSGFRVWVVVFTARDALRPWSKACL